MKNDIITLAHGSGAGLTNQLIKEVFNSQFKLPSLDDSVQINPPHQQLLKTVATTDAFVVKPLFFPGGDIGKLSICGTVNDLSMSGAIPAYILACFIIEEGFSISNLKMIVHSMQEAADESGVRIVAGDTKVVERGKCDGLYITTSGIGYVSNETNLSVKNIAVNDKIVVNGTLADHSIAIINVRQELDLDPAPTSDCAPLVELIQLMTTTKSLKFARDATRGGVVTILNEVYCEIGLGMIIEEELIPVKQSTTAICDMLGLDPLYMANEGKFIAFIPSENQNIVNELKKQKYGKEATVIGYVTDEVDGVYLRTSLGGLRPLRMLASDPLPRIC